MYRPRHGRSMPAVLVVHGGSWSGRAPQDMDRICGYLAARGFVAVNVAYRLAPQFLYPAALRDLEQALNWMIANAEWLGIDPGRIGAFGYSAGAHLVALLALTESATALRNRLQRGYSLRAVVAGGIPADLTTWPQSPVIKRFLGVSFRADPQLWVEASPMAHVSATAPPFLLFHGGMDRLVEAEQSRRLQKRLAANGVRAELHIVPFHGHLSMFLLNRSALRRSGEFLSGILGD